MILSFYSDFTYKKKQLNPTKSVKCFLIAIQTGPIFQLQWAYLYLVLVSVCSSCSQTKIVQAGLKLNLPI